MTTWLLPLVLLNHQPLAAQTEPVQTEPGLGDPRTRGGARDLAPEEPDDTGEAPATRAFRLNTTGDTKVGPAALSPEGRYGAYVLGEPEGDRWRVVMVDTASATLRAVGPSLDNQPEAIALTRKHLLIAQDGALTAQPWFAAGSRSDALARADEGAPKRQTAALSANASPSPSPSNDTDLVVDEAGAQFASSALENGGRPSIWVGPVENLAAARTFWPQNVNRCPFLSFGARGLLLFAACEGANGWTLLRLDLGGETISVDREINLTAPGGMEVAGISAIGGTTPVVAWASEGRGELRLYSADGALAKREPLQFRPARVVAQELSAVVASETGVVWLVGLDEGGTLIGLESPVLDPGPGVAAPAIANDGSTVLIAADARQAALRVPTVWVVPALR